MEIPLDDEFKRRYERLKKSFTIEGKLEYLRESLEKHRRLAEWHEYQAKRHRIIIKYIEVMIEMLELKLRRRGTNATTVQA